MILILKYYYKKALMFSVLYYPHDFQLCFDIYYVKINYCYLTVMRQNKTNLSYFKNIFWHKKYSIKSTACMLVSKFMFIGDIFLR